MCSDSKEIGMQYGLVIDISCCGSDCFGQLNNPVMSSMTIVNEKMEKIKSWVYFVRPEEEITDAALTIHRISRDYIDQIPTDVLDLDTYLSTAYSILSKCRDKGFYLIGFNHMSFDLGILNQHFTQRLNMSAIEWPKDRVVDIMNLCSKYNDFRSVGNFTLDACFVHYFKNDKEAMSEFYGFAHNAENDSLMEIRLLTEFMNVNSVSSFDGLVDMQNKVLPFEVFSWGKYKGLTLEKVFSIDRQYVNWCLKNSDVKTRHPDLIKKIQALYMKV